MTAAPGLQEELMFIQLLNLYPTVGFNQALLMEARLLSEQLILVAGNAIIYADGSATFGYDAVGTALNGIVLSDQLQFPCDIAASDNYLFWLFTTSGSDRVASIAADGSATFATTSSAPAADNVSGTAIGAAGYVSFRVQQILPLKLTT